MNDWKKVLADLAEMRHFFAECAANAAPGSKWRETFTEYVAALVELAQSIREKIGEEDDGK